MGTASDLTENATLDAILGNGHVAAFPNTVYVALFLTLPTDASAGTEVSNVGTGYSRVAVANNSTNWPNASNGEKRNGARIDWPSATGDWGAVVGFGIMHSSTVAANDLVISGYFTQTTYISAGSRNFSLPGFLVIYGD